MKYAWIDRNRGHWPLSVLCEQLDVSVSGYHQHALRLATNDGRKPGTNRISDDALLAQ